MGEGLGIGYRGGDKDSGTKVNVITDRRVGSHLDSDSECTAGQTCEPPSERTLFLFTNDHGSPTNVYGSPALRGGKETQEVLVSVCSRGARALESPTATPSAWAIRQADSQHPLTLSARVLDTQLAGSPGRGNARYPGGLHPNGDVATTAAPSPGGYQVEPACCGRARGHRSRSRRRWGTFPEECSAPPPPTKTGEPAPADSPANAGFSDLCRACAV